jgi:dehydrogenase/reductase SDR family member 1
MTDQKESGAPVAVITGGSRGLGRGVAVALVEEGYRVFVTGRSIDTAKLPDCVVRIVCDHTCDGDTERAFARVSEEANRIDVLVNAAWGGYERMSEDGRFTWSDPFWEQRAHRWTSMMDAGVRAARICASHAARTMTGRGQGLIVNIGYWAARKYVGNTLYGAAKAAMDKMTSDMAHELRPYGVAAVSLYPGLVRTEAVMAAAAGGWLDLKNSESPEFTGRVISALVKNAGLMDRSGHVLIVAELAREFGVLDIDGQRPAPLYSRLHKQRAILRLGVLRKQPEQRGESDFNYR